MQNLDQILKDPYGPEVKYGLSELSDSVSLKLEKSL